MYDDELNVWSAGHHVGFLWRDPHNEMGFQYSEDWLENNVRFPISKTLPLRKEAFEPGRENRIAHHYFANLLPEAGSRQRICREKKISADNDFELLRAIGGECAGALSIVEGEPKASTPLYRELGYDELSNLLLTRNPTAVLKAGDYPPRLSLAGAQEKAPIKFQDGKFFLPLENAISTHILKYQVRDISHVPAYETLTMWIAAELGLEVSETDFYRHAEETFTLSKRFDRVVSETGLLRLHQEDFCQASGRASSRKYEHEGGPTFAECVQLVREHSAQPLKDIPRLIDWQVFNYLVGNSDAHAKNLSFVYGLDHTTRLSPFYDLIAIHAWPSHVFNHQLALSVGGETDVSKIKRDHWKLLADECRLSFTLFESAIQQLSAGLIHALDAATDRFESRHGSYPAFQQLRQALIKNQRLINRALK